MSDLQKIVASLREGDTVKVHMEWHTTSRVHIQMTLEGRLAVNHFGQMTLGGEIVRARPDGGVFDTRIRSVEVLEREPIPEFYRNAPRREPKVGDLAKVGIRDTRIYLFNGKVWHALNESYLTRGEKYQPGDLLLVDPTELEATP